MATKKTSPELIKRLKGCGILSGGALGGMRIVAMGFCYHSNHDGGMATKDAFFRVNRLTIRNSDIVNYGHFLLRQ